MDWLKRDLKVGLRLLAKDRAFSVTALLTLAICIGANTALFAVVYNVLLRPLPVRDADRIVLMSNQYPKAGASDSDNSGVPDYYDRLRAVTALGEQALVNHGSFAIGQDERARRIRVANVTPSYFRMLEARPLAGRAFTEDEAEPGKDRRVVLSEALAISLFGSAPAAVGKDLRLDGESYAVVGVMPKTIDAFDPGVALWRPLAFTAEQKSDSNRHSNNYWNLGRLKPGATPEQAQAQVDVLNAANLDLFPELKPLLINAGFHTTVERYPEHVVRHVKPTLYLLWGGALFVLLIGCVNVANLALARARARSKELATRLAIGAGPGALARQLVIEGVLLALVAAGCGLALGFAALRTLGALNLEELPYGAQIGLSGPVVLFAVAVSVAIGAAMGLVPLASVAPSNLITVLREEGRASSGSRRVRGVRRTLVVLQVAFTFVLLVGAGLLLTSFRRVLDVDRGFASDHVLTASVALPRARYKEDAQRGAFTEESLRRVRALPGVVAAGATDTIPFGKQQSDSVILAEGYVMKPGESVVSPNQVTVTPGYFEAMGVKLVKGRFFDARDGAGAPPTIMVDEKLARKFWPGQDPIGRRLYKPGDIKDLLAVNEKTVYLTVVGVLADVKLHDLTEADTTVGAYFTPMAQDTSRLVTYAIKTTGPPETLAAPLRGVVASLDRELAVFEMESMEDRMRAALVDRKAPSMLSLAFGLVALLLSAVGIYGVLTYLVTQRSKEIGIRMALGSTTKGIFDLVLREGLVLVAVGFVLGAGVSLALHKSLDSLLYGIRATDPAVLGITTLLLGAVALVACALPARRATRIDPLIVLSE